jgi:predicted RNA-binding protein YlqC (UPF0109 family)
MKGRRKLMQLTPDLRTEKVAEVSRLLQALIRQLVDHTDQVSMLVISDAQKTTFHVDLCQSDVGKVIGRSGRMAIALRIILAGIAKKLMLDLRLNIVNSDDHL